MSTGTRAVFLDRDGVLNAAVVREGRPYPPATADEVVVLPGVVEACARLVAGGWLLVVVTNQPDIARGMVTRRSVDEINDRVTADLGVTEVVVCPHDDADRCGCRKPEPGMLVDAAERWGIDLAASVMVGDRWRDVAAGCRAGTTTIFVDRHYDEVLRDQPDHVVADLPGAVELLVPGPRGAT